MTDGILREGKLKNYSGVSAGELAMHLTPPSSVWCDNN